MIFGSLRIVIPLSISFYYLIKKGFKGNIAQISLLQMIAFINAVFFLPTLIKFFKRLILNKKIEKIFKTASEKDLKENDICIICRLKMQPNMAKKLPCGHCYHLECLERWIGENDSCPICLEKISNLLEKEKQMKQKKKRRRKHRKEKSENENNVFNYNDISNNINDKFENSDFNIEEEEEEKSDHNENEELKELKNNNNNDDAIVNDFNVDDGAKKDNQENFTENNSVINDIKVIDLDKICSNDDDGYYYYSDYYDEPDQPCEKK